MKKIIAISVMAFCLAGCSKESPIGENPDSGTFSVPVCISVGDDTRATYGADLAATWESGDQIEIVQAVKETTVGTLANTAENTNVFSGYTLVASQSSKTFHFAYPAGSLTKAKNDDAVTCTFTIPSEQHGKWTPFLHTTKASTPEGLASLNIAFGATQGSALAVRVFDKNKENGKNDIVSITVSAVNNIVGTITDGVASATSNEISLASPIVYTTGVVTIDTKDVTYYEYRFNVLPVESGIITITLNDGKRTVTASTTAGTTFVANTRKGLNILWPADEATTTVTASFDDAIDGGWTDLFGTEVTD